MKKPKIFSNSKIYIIAFIFYLLFHRFFENIFNISIVVPFLSSVESIWYEDAIIIFISFLIIYNSYKKIRKKYIITTNRLVLYTLFLIVFLYYRITENPWEFTEFSLFDFVKYLDIIILFIFSEYMVFYFNNKSKKNTSTKNLLFLDLPIEDLDDDKLGFKNYASELSKILLNSSYQKAFSLGINGKWGEGKTSFIKLLKINLKKNDDIIIIDFDVWKINRHKNIIDNFFILLQNKLSPYHSSISILISKYSKLLKNLNGNIFTVYNNYLTSNDLYNDINSILVDLDKKIFVFIDDVDRLTTKETREVINLIRNTANFANTYFIVAYDQQYIIQSLRKTNSYNTEKFLEKIFQIEINLPSYNKKILRAELADLLKEKLPEKNHSFIENSLLDSTLSTPKYLDKWLTNYRDIIRLANSLIINGKKLWGEVKFSDFLRIELLRINYPEIYSILYTNKKKYFSLDSDNKFILAESQGKIILYEDFEDNDFKKKYSLNKFDIERIKELIGSIFEYDYSYSTSIESHLSIKNYIRFDIYFSYGLSNNNLSELEFIKTINKSFSEIKQEIDKWIDKYLEIEVKYRFVYIEDFQSKYDFEKILKSIFYLANKKSKIISDRIGLVGYDAKDFFYNKLNNTNKLIETYYNYDEGKKDLKKFIENLFDTAPYPYLFESQLIYYYKHNQLSITNFILNKKEMNDISFKYLKEYCQKGNFDYSFWDLYHSSKNVEWIKEKNSNVSHKKEKLSDRMKSLLRNCLLDKGLDFFIFWIIDFEPFNKKTFSINQKIIIDIFDSFENFQNTINKLHKKESKYLNEFKEFLDLFIKKGSRHYVEFKFKTIPIEERFK